VNQCLVMAAKIMKMNLDDLDRLRPIFDEQMQASSEIPSASKAIKHSPSV